MNRIWEIVLLLAFILYLILIYSNYDQDLARQKLSVPMESELVR